VFNAIREGWSALLSIAIAVLQLIGALIKYFRRSE
jgi:hypothetical protein